MDSGSVNIRTLHIILRFIITIIGGFLLFYILVHVFSEDLHFYTDMVGAILILVSLSISYYVANIFSGADTNLSVSYGYLTIESQTTFGNLSNFKKIALDQIKAYEIHNGYFGRASIGEANTAVVQLLVFYRYDQSPIVLVLKRLSLSEQQQLKSFIESHHIVSIKELKTLSGQSFKQAFLRSLLVLFAGLAAFLVLYIFELFILYNINHRLPGLNILTAILTLTMIFTTTYFIVKKLQRVYRVQADGTWIVMGIMLPFTAYFIQDRLEVFLQQPLQIEETTQVKLYPYQRFFVIGNFSCDTTLTGYYKSVSSGERKTLFSTVNHYFTSPIITKEDSPTKLNHQYWVSNSYSQKIRKTLSNEEQNRQRVTFMNQKLHDFNTLLNKTPPFFEIVYSGLNPRVRTKNNLFSVLSIGRIKNPLFILRPHIENFGEFIASIQKQSVIITTIFFGLLVINALLIAIYR